jgi:hypothetical protein
LQIQIPPGRKRRSFAKARVEVHQHLDGLWSVFYQGEKIAVHPKTALQEPQRARVKTRRSRSAKGADEVFLVYFWTHRPAKTWRSRFAASRSSNLNDLFHSRHKESRDRFPHRPAHQLRSRISGFRHRSSVNPVGARMQILSLPPVDPTLCS